MTSIYHMRAKCLEQAVCIICLELSKEKHSAVQPHGLVMEAAGHALSWFQLLHLR